MRSDRILFSFFICQTAAASQMSICNSSLEWTSMHMIEQPLYLCAHSYPLTVLIK